MNSNNSVQDFHNTLTQIQDLKILNDGLFGGMIKYDVNNVAFEFFPDSFLDAKKKENKTSLRPIDIDYIHERIAYFEKSIADFRQILLDIEENSNFSDLQKEFLQAIIEKSIIQLQYFQKSIWFEAEKSWQFWLNKAKRAKLLEEINALQDVVYGSEITPHEDEKQMILESIHELYQKNSEKITEKERKILMKFFQKFDFKENITTKEVDNKVENPLNIKPFTWKTDKENILAEKDFEQIIRLTLELYGLIDDNNSEEWNWKIDIDENASMFSVKFSKKTVVVPKDKIATTSIFRLLQLLDHEIGVHAIRGHNTIQSLRIAGSNYLDAEEGLATHSEEMFENEIEDITGGVTLHHITTFIAENYNAEDTEKLLQIFFKLQWSKNPEKLARDRMFRVKRFVSFDLPGANRKDVAYTRGNIEISQKLSSFSDEERKEFLKKFYFAKLALEDQKFVPEFEKIFGTKNHKYPLWVGKIIFKKLLWEKIFFDEFMKQDGRFVMDSINYETKKNIVRILRAVRNKMSWHKNKNTHL